MIKPEWGVLFYVQEHPGMVGETHIDYLAYQVVIVPFKAPVVKRRQLSYKELKGIYNSFVRGKADRQRFWGWMKEFSPGNVERRGEETTAEAISFVI